LIKLILELFMLGLIRVAIIVLIALLIYRLLKRWLASLPHKSNKAPDKIGRMVRCEYCHLHIPESEALHGANGWYCSEEHRKLDRPAD
jgi:uncharacterized protein